MARVTETLKGRTIVLWGLLVVTGAVVIPLAYLWRGWEGLASASVAWLVNLAGGLAALWFSHMLREPAQVVAQVLAGMFLRMGIPLAACMVVYLRGGMLADAGFVYYIMAFYFVTLAVETVLLARWSPNGPTKSQTG